MGVFFAIGQALSYCWMNVLLCSVCMVITVTSLPLVISIKVVIQGFFCRSRYIVGPLVSPVYTSFVLNYFMIFRYLAC